MASSRETLRRGLVGSCLALVGLTLSSTADAWLLTEHTDLTERAARVLPNRLWKTLDAAWKLTRGDAVRSDARAWRRGRLCRSFNRPEMTRPVDDDWCISFSSLPALAADHACSPSELTRTIASAPWLESLVAEGVRARAAMAAARDDDAIYDARRLHDVKLQFIDPNYAGRAANGTAHFQETRRFDTLERHLRDVLSAGSEQHALALYLSYHLAALRLADEAVLCATGTSLGTALRPPPQGCEPDALSWRAFTHEGFALHFLEDAFSSGHVVGSWGDDAERKGTHDYYCREGLDVTTWEAASYVAHGDAYLTDEDGRHVAKAAAASLRQLALVLGPLTPEAHRWEREGPEARQIVDAARRIAAPDELDVCLTSTVTAGLDRLAAAPFVTSLVATWPRPPRRSPALPRFDTEFGFFVGGSVAFGMGAIVPLDAGVAEWEGQAQVGLGLGFSGDGLFEGRAYGRFGVEGLLGALHNVSRADSAFGLGLRVQLPFAVLPGDIVLLGPLAALGWGWPAEQIAKGGAIPIFRPVSLSESARFQLALGREVALLWFLPHGVEPSPRPRRFQVRVPALEVAFADRYHGAIGQEWQFVAGLQYDHLGDVEGSALGVYGAFGLQARTFP
ncbi:MAG: hypothetical protein R3B72_12420 [Polyangiaceae bacterium]